MEKINEKRLVVLKVALELLKIEQTSLKTSLELAEGGEIRTIEEFKKFKEQPFIKTQGNRLYALTFVANHLKRKFDGIELPEELQELKEQNVLIALEIIHKIMLQEVFSASEFAESTKILGLLRKNSFEGL